MHAYFLDKRANAQQMAALKRVLAPAARYTGAQRTQVANTLLARTRQKQPTVWAQIQGALADMRGTVPASAQAPAQAASRVSAQLPAGITRAPSKPPMPVTRAAPVTRAPSKPPTPNTGAPIKDHIYV